MDNCSWDVQLMNSLRISSRGTHSCCHYQLSIYDRRCWISPLFRWKLRMTRGVVMVELFVDNVLTAGSIQKSTDSTTRLRSSDNMHY